MRVLNAEMEVVFRGFFFFCFFKQKTAYEMRISDWSSDVCSSDLKDKWDVYLKDAHACVDEARRGMVKGTPVFAKCVGDDDPRFSKAINEAQQKYAVTPAWQAAASSERESVFYASAEQTRATRKEIGRAHV